MEVCVESIESAKNAVAGGAIRIELCSALSEGGLTPSVGLFKAMKSVINIPIFVMIRPRSGHFTYNAEDLAAVKYDAQIFLEAGADGFVFGALTKDGCVDIAACQEFLQIVADKPVTFHRAFDWTSNPYHAMEQIITLGFQRILTSGQQDTALNGLSLISDLVEKAENRIIIMPGSGINCNNIMLIAAKSRANEFHASARTNKLNLIFRNAECSMGSQDEFEKVTCSDHVRTMVQSFHSARQMY